MGGVQGLMQFETHLRSFQERIIVSKQAMQANGQCHAQIQSAEDLPVNLVGHHIKSGAWLKKLKQSNRNLLGVYLLAGMLALACAFVCYKANVLRRKDANHIIQNI